MFSTNALTLTRDNGRLTPSQRHFYEDNGYLLLRKVIPQELLQRCSQRFEDIVTGEADRGGMVVMRDVKDRKSVNKLQELNFDQVFRKYIENKGLLDIVESFIGPNIIAVHSMLIAKPPDSGFGTSRHPPHQDLYYFPFRPEDKIVAAWTAIEKCDVENGCLYISPGSHKKFNLLPHSYPMGTGSDTFNAFYHGIQNLPEKLPWVNVEMEPGDTVFFHPLLVHGSGLNKSMRTRKAISAHYAAADCHYINVKGTLQEGLSNEIITNVKKRLGEEQNISYADIWKFKSSLVRGIRSNL